MFHPLLTWLTAVCLLALSPDAAPAGPAQDAAGQKGGDEAPVLKLNVSTDGYPPYLIVSGEEYGGIAYDVTVRIARRMGYRVEPREIPRKREDSMLLEGHIDATPRAREWTKNPDQFLFTDPIVMVQEVFFTTADSSFRFRGLDSLRDITVLTPLGYQYPSLQPLFDQGRIERYEVSNDRDVFAFLLHGRGFDAGIADVRVAQWIIRQNGWQGRFRHSGPALTNVGYRLVVRPEWTSFVEAFNRRLAEMKASGELDEILEQYR